MNSILSDTREIGTIPFAGHDHDTRSGRNVSHADMATAILREWVWLRSNRALAARLCAHAADEGRKNRGYRANIKDTTATDASASSPTG